MSAWHPGHPTEQDATASKGPLQVLGALLDRQAPGDGTHRTETDELAGLALHGLIGNRRSARLHECIRQGRDRRQVQVREKQLVLPQVRILGGERLLDLDHHILGPGFTCILGHVRPGGDVGGVGKAGPLPRGTLHQYFVAICHISGHTRGSRTYAKLLRFDLTRNSNAHWIDHTNFFDLEHAPTPVACHARQGEAHLHAPDRCAVQSQTGRVRCH